MNDRQMRSWFLTLARRSRLLAMTVFILTIPIAVLYDLFIEGFGARVRELRLDVTETWRFLREGGE